MPSVDRQPPGDGRGRRATPRNLCALPRAPRRVPLSGGDRGAWEERDRALLARIADARLRGDERSARLAAGELLVPYLPAIELLVVSRTRWLALCRCDREEIASGALERLVRELVCEPDLHGASFGAVVTMKVKDQISDFLSLKARRWRLVREELTAPEELPEPVAHSDPTPFEQAVAAEAILRPLAPGEQEIVYERYVLDLSIGEVAASRGIQPDAVKKACMRGARKIREARAAREAHEARKAREAREAREARQANNAREADGGREARNDPEASDANSMSTFLASHSGIGDEGPTEDTRTGKSVGLSNQKSRSEPHEDKS